MDLVLYTPRTCWIILQSNVLIIFYQLSNLRQENPEHGFRTALLSTYLNTVSVQVLTHAHKEWIHLRLFLTTDSQT